MKAVGQVVIGLVMLLLVFWNGMSRIEVVQNASYQPQYLAAEFTPTPSPTPAGGDCQDSHCVRP